MVIPVHLTYAYIPPLEEFRFMAQKETKSTVRIFALASFLNDFGSDMIYPIWPFFVTVVMNADMATLGFIDGLGDAVVSISQAVSGYASDKIGNRKAFVWSGYLFGASSRVGYALSTTWQHLVPFRILDRAGKMRGAPRDAIIADISTRENRGENFGILRAMDNLGAVCGIIVCILLLELLGYRNLFLLAAVPSVIGAILILILIRERRSDTKLYKGFSLRNTDKGFRVFLLAGAIFALGSFSYSFLLIYARQFFIQPSSLPVLYLLFTVIASVSSIPFGRLADSVGRKPVLILSYAFWGMICLSLIFTSSYWMTIICFILYGLHRGAIDIVQKVFVSELSSEKYRATSLGSFQLVIGISALPSSLIAGILWDQIGVYAPFFFSLCLTILSLAVLGFVKEGES